MWRNAFGVAGAEWRLGERRSGGALTPARLAHSRAPFVPFTAASAARVRYPISNPIPQYPVAFSICCAKATLFPVENTRCIAPNAEALKIK